MEDISEKKQRRKRRLSGAKEKRSNEDRVLLYFIRARWKWPFRMLGLMFGVSDRCASNYYYKVLTIVLEHFSPRLFYLPNASETIKYIPDRFKSKFPNTLLVGDGFHVSCMTPEDFALQGLSFSIYKWDSTMQLIICE